MKRILHVLSLAFLLTYSLTCVAVLPSRMLDAAYYWAMPVYDADATFSIEIDPGSSSFYHWTHAFVFANSSPEAARRGFTGLQTVAHARKAIFSIENALEATGRNCHSFSENGMGYQCIIDYSFKEGQSYRFMVWRLMSDETGDWWGSWILDSERGKVENIGLIKAPANSGLIRESHLLDEYAAEVDNCAGMPAAMVKYSLMGNRGEVTPYLHRIYPQGSCQNYVQYEPYYTDFLAITPRAALRMPV